MYSKDYFTGMKHLADAVKYGLDNERYRYEKKAKNCGDIDVYSECTNIAGGIEIATKILNTVLTIQLEVKGDGDEV